MLQRSTLQSMILHSTLCVVFISGTGDKIHLEFKCGPGQFCEAEISGKFQRKDKENFTGNALGGCKDFACNTKILELKVGHGGTDAWKCENVT